MESMDAALERAMRETLAAEQFGVLATIFEGRLHTATVHVAETPELEMVFAIRPTTLKARLADGNPRATLQVDNRAVAVSHPQAFLRLSFEGLLRVVPEDDGEYGFYRKVFADKLPVGEEVLASPGMDLYVLRPFRVRIAQGGNPAQDVTITYEADEEPDAPPPPTRTEPPAPDLSA